MSNKLDKFLISLSGMMAVALGIIGFKFQEEMSKTKVLREDLQKSLVSAEKVEAMIDLQAKLEAARLENLQKVDNSKVGSKTETKTQTVVIPGKTVPKTTTTTKTTKTS